MKYPCMFFLLIFFLFACSFNKEQDYYPKYHYTAFYRNIGAKPVYLFWGDRLVSGGGTVRTNLAGQVRVYYRVIWKQEHSTGYVDQDSVIKNVLSACVILKKAALFETPTAASRRFEMNVTPMLAYITEIINGEWVKLDMYRAPAVYMLTNIMEDADKPDWKWVHFKDISTNRFSVDLMIGLQIAIRNYHETRNAYNYNPDEKNKTALIEELKNDISNLMKIQVQYAGAEKEAVRFCNNFLSEAETVLNGIGEGEIQNRELETNSMESDVL